MGVLDAVFGANGERATAETEAGTGTSKYAILLNAGPESLAVGGNAFNYAVELDDGGHDVQVFLDGVATQWPVEFSEDPDRPFHHYWTELQRRDLLAGACGYCANAFDVAEGCEDNGVDLLSEKGQHAPSVADLVDDGYELLTIG